MYDSYMAWLDIVARSSMARCEPSSLVLCGSFVEISGFR